MSTSTSTLTLCSLISAPVNVRLERSELLAPVGLDLIEPRLECDEWLRLKLEQPHARVIRRPLILNQSAL
jgi:hypothetical protein